MIAEEVRGVDGAALFGSGVLGGVAGEIDAFAIVVEPGGAVIVGVALAVVTEEVIKAVREGIAG